MISISLHRRDHDDIFRILAIGDIIEHYFSKLTKFLSNILEINYF